MANAKTAIRSAAKRGPKGAGSAAALSTREEALAAASTVFLEHGYRSTSMDQIAETSGLARRTLYNLFPGGKSAIFAATVEQVWQNLPTVHLTGSTDPVVGLSRYGQAVAKFWQSEQSVAFLRMVIIENGRFPRLAEHYFDPDTRSTFGIFVEYLARMSNEGKVQIEDSELAARQFTGMIKEPLLWPRLIGLEVAPTDEECAKAVEGAVGSFLAAYGAGRKTS